MIELLSSSVDSWDEALSWLARMSLAAGLILIVAIAADMLLARRVSARWRSLLYLAVLARIALPVGWASPVGLLGQTSAPERTAMVDAGLAATSRVAAVAPASEPMPSPGVGWPLVAWTIGIGLLAGGAVMARLLLARDVRHARPAGPRVAGMIAGLDVLEHDRRGPAAFGVFAPRIVMPSPLVETLDDDELRGVLRHEAAHVRRRDPLRLALLQCATFLAWPLLPAWIAAWRLRGLMEQACDEAALRDASAEERRSFGHALLAVAAWQPLRSRFAVAMLPFGGGLRARLSALRFTRRWPAALQAGVATALAIAPLLVLGARAGRAGMAGMPATVASPATAGRVPPVMILRAELFQSVPGADASGTRFGELRFEGGSEDAVIGRVLTTTEADEALRGVRGTDRTIGQTFLKCYVGGSFLVHFRLPPSESSLPGAASDRVVMRWGPAIDEGALRLSLGVVSGESPMAETVATLAEGQSVLLTALRDHERGALNVLLTPKNVTFSAGGARVESEHLSFRSLKDGARASELLEGLAHMLPGPVIVEPPDAGALLASLEVRDVPVEVAVEAIADAAGLEPVMTNGMLKLIAPQADAPAQDVMLEYRVARVRCGDLESLGLALPAGARDRRPVVVPVTESAFDLDLALSRLEEAGSATTLSRPMIMVRIGEDAEIESGRLGREPPSVRVSGRVTRSGEELSVHVRALVDGKFEFEGDLEPPAAIVWPGRGRDCRIAVLHARPQRGVVSSP